MHNPVVSACKHIYHFGHLKVVHPYDEVDSYHIFIDSDYTGKVVKLKGNWIGEMDYDNNLTIDQIQQLGKIIDEKVKQAR